MKSSRELSDDESEVSEDESEASDSESASSLSSLLHRRSGVLASVRQEGTAIALAGGFSRFQGVGNVGNGVNQRHLGNVFGV